MFGKDWHSIERHVGTRDIVNVRAHGQKFLAKLLRFIEGKKPIKAMSLEEAEFYYGTLSQKLHKSMKWTNYIQDSEIENIERSKEDNTIQPPSPPRGFLVPQAAIET